MAVRHVVEELEARLETVARAVTGGGSDGAPLLAVGDAVALCHRGTPLLGSRIYLD